MKLILNLFFSELSWLIARSKLKKIKLIVFDLDGVMTDGYLYINDKGEQIKRFNVKDGLGIKILQLHRFEIAVISGGKGDVAKQRLKDLNIKYYFFKVKNKKECLKEIQGELKLGKDKTLYVGDDLNDLPVKNEVSLLVGTNDANYEFKKKCDLVLRSKGGNNAIREVTERLVEKTIAYKNLLKNGFIQLN